jgi:hypothetical protein
VQMMMIACYILIFPIRRRSVMNDNRLIAEFMGFQKTDIGWYDSNEIVPPMYDGNTFDEYELSFDTSWDWLMPVVEKCLKTGDNTDKWDDVYNAVCTIDIKEVYKAVVFFINNRYVNEEELTDMIDDKEGYLSEEMFLY